MAQAAPDFGLRAGRETLPASAPPAALAAFVAKANAAVRIEGLPDGMNPRILDADKVAHLVAALPSQPAATLARLAGHDLLLDDPGLQVHAAFPSQPNQPVTLEIDEVQGQTVLAHIDAAADPALARSRAQDAAARFQAADHAAPQGDAVRLAQERRQAVARVWRMNAQAWAHAAPSDLDAKQAAAAADAAISATALPPRGGTVPP